MSDYNEEMNYQEMTDENGLSKEDLAGAGLLAAAMVVGVGLYEGGKKGIEAIGAKLDEKGKNPITAIKKKRLEKKLEREVRKAAEEEMFAKKMAEVKAKAENEETEK